MLHLKYSPQDIEHIPPYKTDTFHAHFNNDLQYLPYKNNLSMCPYDASL